jgi:excisionase family DNA binding protein
MNVVEESAPVAGPVNQREIQGFEVPVDVKTAARFLGVSPSLVYAYVERKQIPHFRMMGRAIRFSISELEKWRRQYFVNGGIDEQNGETT